MKKNGKAIVNGRVFEVIDGENYIDGEPVYKWSDMDHPSGALIMSFGCASGAMLTGLIFTALGFAG